MSRIVERSWGDLVFHVLSHVRGTAHLAASTYDPAYVAFVREHLGPAENRTLGEDAVILAREAPDHRTLVRAQSLAWLFHDVARAEPLSDKALSAIGQGEVDNAAWLAAVQRDRAAELLWCAALLELDAWRALPPCRPAMGPWMAELGRAAQVAPALAHCDVALVRSLRMRGRVIGREIWVGVPDDALGLCVSHIAWQAAHEATVLEAGEAARAMSVPLGHDALEHASVVLLAIRAAHRHRFAEHEQWYRHLGATAPGLCPDCLSAAARRVVDACLKRQDG